MSAWKREAFSDARLAPYLAVGGSAEAAWALYVWNIEVSAAFLGPLHCLETVLRNALHRELQRHFGLAEWWDSAPLSPKDQAMLDDARRKLGRRGQRPAGADAVVAELSFGFWVSLVSRVHDRHLWVPALHRAFPHYRGPRRGLHDQLDSLRLFRNRIMHHEPIHHRSLADDHAKLYRVLGFLNPEAVTAIRPLDRVPEVLRVRADTIAGRRPARF
ncbi:hypothetical protein [Kitasatospora sp. MMS16-BH015]|uniref:hypothetical protein n=1 Tax=Kitasatospora sp. MMS16-BH015 TaxID=2018025 RepID=UPI000CF2D483|nr:hypothetical protein [Kitasatospora sp. MMS16-BH015]